MSILRLKPTCTSYIWGGRRLAEEYGFTGAPGSDRLAEAWVCQRAGDGDDECAGDEWRRAADDDGT